MAAPVNQLLMTRHITCDVSVYTILLYTEILYLVSGYMRCF